MRSLIPMTCAAVLTATSATAQIGGSHWVPGHADANGAWIDGHRDYAKSSELTPLLAGAAAPGLTREEQLQADRRAHRQLQGVANAQTRIEADRERDEEKASERRSKDDR